MRVLNRLLLFLLLVCVGALPAKAASDRASDIMREVEKRGRVDSQTYQGAVDVIGTKGKVLSRRWQLWQEADRGASKLRIRFDAPAEMRGVTLLSLSGPDGRKTWLYTPSNRRLRPLAQQERTQRFMGTDLTNEDMEEHPAEDYSYQLIGEQELDSQPEEVEKLAETMREPAFRSTRSRPMRGTTMPLSTRKQSCMCVKTFSLSLSLSSILLGNCRKPCGKTSGNKFRGLGRPC